MIKQKNGITHSIWVIGLAILFTGCTTIYPSPRTTPPCETADCYVEIIMSGDSICCGTAEGWLARNKHASLDIVGVFLQETFDGEHWVATRIDTFFMPFNSYVYIGCTKNDNQTCQRSRRYSLRSARFSQSSISSTPYVPTNPDLPPFNCLSCVSTSGCSSTINYKTLPQTQQKIIYSVWHKLLNHKSNDTLPAQMFSILSPSWVDTSCFKRINKITNRKFESWGNHCEIGVKLPTSLAIGNTGNTYNSLWFTFPSVVNGPIVLSSDTSRIDFDIHNGNRILITVSDDSGKTRRDVVNRIYAIKSGRKLVIAGKDFVCYTIDNISD